MKKIQTVSTYLITIFNVILWGYPIFFTLQWALRDWAPMKYLLERGFFTNDIVTPEGPVKLLSLVFTPLSWSIGYTAEIIGFMPLFLTLLLLKRIFQNYRRGIIFSLENAKNYKYIGWLFFLSALVIGPLSNMMMVLSATLSNPPGHRYITVYFGTPNVEDIICGLLVIVISWIMAESYKLKEDQTLTI